MSAVSFDPRQGLARKPSFLASLKVQIRIIGALMMREASAKYGHESLGFFWVMGEPLLLTTGVMIMWTMSSATHGHSDIGIIPFALSGYSMLTLWRHIMGPAALLMRRNAGLLFHRNIRMFDVLIARALLETVGILTAFFIAYVPLSLLGFVDYMRDPLLLLGGWCLQAWFCFSFAMIITGLSELAESVERFVPPVLYITLPLSGAFYMLYWMPEGLRDLLTWSPLVNTNEMFRSGLFPADVPTFYSGWYVVLWCLALMAIGLPLLRKAQKNVTME